MVTLRSAVLSSAFSAQPIPTQSRITDAQIAKDGTAHITFSDGRTVQVPMEKGQEGRERLQIALSGRSIGWLEVDVPVGSYSVPTTLTVYTVGEPLRHFGDGLMLLDWDFVDDDKHIKFSSSQVHGPGTAWLTNEVHDLKTGRLLQRWLEQSDLAETAAPLATVNGRVADTRGVALPDTIVSIRSQPDAEPSALTTSTGDGQFSLHGISPGEYEVRFEHPRFKTRIIKITVAPSAKPVDAGAVTLENQPASRK